MTGNHGLIKFYWVASFLFIVTLFKNGVLHVAWNVCHTCFRMVVYLWIDNTLCLETHHLCFNSAEKISEFLAVSLATSKSNTSSTITGEQLEEHHFISINGMPFESKFF